VVSPCGFLKVFTPMISACSVVRMSLNWISCACSERPEVWQWYFSFWLRSLAP
jgi:hypothetical protein